MKKKLSVLLIIFLPAGLVLIVAGALMLSQPRYAIIRETQRTPTTRLPPTSTIAPIFTYTSSPVLAASPSEENLLTSPTTTVSPAPFVISPTALHTITLTPSPIPPTKTPLPTQTPCLNCTSTPSYLSTLVSVMKTIAGEWSGTASMTVNRQARPHRLIRLTLYDNCVSGQVCGEYHDESSCSGFLTFHKLRGSTYIFASHPLTNVEKCNPAGFFYLKPKADGNLALTISIRDLDGRIISRSATLNRLK